MEANVQEGESVISRTVADTGSLAVRGERSGGTLIAVVAGRVDGTNAGEFQNALETLLGEDVAAVVLDLEGLSYISSAGLRVLLVVARQLQKRAAQFGVCSLADSVAEIFKISGFGNFIPVHAARADALAAIAE